MKQEREEERGRTETETNTEYKYKYKRQINKHSHTMVRVSSRVRIYQLEAPLFPNFELHSHSIPDMIIHSRYGNGNGKLHSRISGTGMGIENCIPNFWERERE